MYQANHDIDDNDQDDVQDTNEFKFDVDGTLLREHAVPGGKTWQEGSLGKRLRKTRESQRISVPEVSERLYLERYIIEGLETDDYSKLPPRAFVQGYVRSYAKFLNIPAEPMLQCLREQYGNDDDSQLSYNAPKDIPEAEATSKDPWFKLFTLFLVAAVLIGFGLWWSENNFELPKFLPPSSEETNATETPAPPNTSGSILPMAPESLSSEAPPAQPALDSADYQPPGEADDAEGPEDFGGVKPPDTPPATPAQATEAEKTPEPETVATAPPTTAAADNTVPPDATPATSTALIVLKAKNDCWTEVTDANGKKLVAGMIKAGETRELNGTAPFKLKLGRPQALTLTYQGKAVDLSSYANSIARLTLK